MIEKLYCDSLELPVGVGPHDGKELSLMLAGVKPVAMFYDTVPECGVIPRQEFEPFVTSGRIMSKEVTFRRKSKAFVPAVFVFYAQPWALAEMVQLEEIHRWIYDGTCADDAKADMQIGRLLGYTHEEISVYLTWRTQMLASVPK